MTTMLACMKGCRPLTSGVFYNYQCLTCKHLFTDEWGFLFDIWHGQAKLLEQYTSK